MKKIAITILINIFLINIQSQDIIEKRHFQGGIYCDNFTYLEYKGMYKDTISVYQDSISVEFTLNKPIKIRYNIIAFVENSSNCEIKYQGRTFSCDHWKDIPRFNDNFYKRYIRVLIINKGNGVSKINFVALKLYYHCQGYKYNYYNEKISNKP
jgi:hypothetical protein